MDPLEECAELVVNRENLYRFLTRIYGAEVDQSLWRQMAGMSFPTEGGDAELVEGYRLLGAYLRGSHPDPLTDLAVDYARVFLGVGINEGVAAYPYESVYTSPERLIMQDARDQVLAVYRAKGLEKVSALDVPEDHVALECEFMARLCRESREALAQGNCPVAYRLFEEQGDFLESHLLNWLPAFCADIQKCAATDFYRAVGKITNGYLRMERAIIDDLLAEPIIAAGGAAELVSTVTAM